MTERAEHRPLPTRARVDRRSPDRRVLYVAPCSCGRESPEASTVERARLWLGRHIGQHRGGR